MTGKREESRIFMKTTVATAKRATAVHQALSIGLPLSIPPPAHCMRLARPTNLTTTPKAVSTLKGESRQYGEARTHVLLALTGF